jgi:hypothetical protein
MIREPLLILWRQAVVCNVKAEGAHTNITVHQSVIYISRRNWIKQDPIALWPQMDLVYQPLMMD